MLEYFAYSKYKKRRDEKNLAEAKAQGDRAVVLTNDDENFLKQIEAEAPVTDDELVVLSGANTPQTRSGAATPEGPAERDIHAADALKSLTDLPEGTEKLKENSRQKIKRWSSTRIPFISRKSATLAVPSTSDAPAAPETKTQQELDISRALDELSLVADGQSAFSLDEQTKQLATQFMTILKDLVNGVPTAYDDLTHFFDREEPQLQKQYEKLPSFLRKIVETLPTKLANKVAPELIAVSKEGATTADKVTAATSLAAKAGIVIPSLRDLAKPGAIASVLKNIMNALKLRWPAFMGTGVLWSLGLFVLLFVFWYCHKRGREVRKEGEQIEREKSREVLVPGAKPEAVEDAPVRPSEIEEPSTPPAESSK